MTVAHCVAAHLVQKPPGRTEELRAATAGPEESYQELHAYFLVPEVVRDTFLLLRRCHLCSFATQQRGTSGSSSSSCTTSCAPMDLLAGYGSGASDSEDDSVQLAPAKQAAGAQLPTPPTQAPAATAAVRARLPNPLADDAPATCELHPQLHAEQHVAFFGVISHTTSASCLCIQPGRCQ